MEIKKECLFRKIPNKYIIEIIISYIKYENFIYKLIRYSKHCQKILNLKLLDFQIKYYHNKICYENFLSNDEDDLSQKFQKFISENHYEENIIKKGAVSYFKEYY